MRLHETASSLQRRALRPSTWAAALVFGGLWVAVRVLSGIHLGDMGIGEFLVPTLLLAGHILLAPLPWQWSGDEGGVTGTWRGGLQAVPWNAAWLGIFLLVLQGAFRPPPQHRDRVGGSATPAAASGTASTPAPPAPSQPLVTSQPSLGSETPRNTPTESATAVRPPRPKESESVPAQGGIDNRPPRPEDGNDVRPRPASDRPPRPQDCDNTQRRPNGDDRQPRRENGSDGRPPRPEDRDTKAPRPDEDRRPPRREALAQSSTRDQVTERITPSTPAPAAQTSPRIPESTPVPQPAPTRTETATQPRPAPAEQRQPPTPQGLLPVLPEHRSELMLLLMNFPFAIVLGWFLAQKERAESTEEELQALARAARTKALQSQLHPHALYNTLSGLTELVHEDPDAAEEALVGLTELLRMLTRHANAAELPLAQERALVKRFLAIEEIRLGPRLTVTWNWPDWADAVVLPPLLLQPLVENAVKHGIATAPEGGALKVGVFRSNRDLVLRVANTGTPLPEKAPEGTGLQNLRERLSLLEQLGPSLDLRTEEGWTVAELRLRIG